MKKYTLIPVALIVFIFSACQKGLDDTVDGGTGNTNSYFVEFKANGVEKNYTGYTLGTFNMLATLYACNIVGQEVTGGATDGMDIQITDTIPITTSTYTDATVAGTYQGALLYTDSTGKQFSSILTTVTTSIQITISENTTDHVSGTFSGNLQNAQDVVSGDTTHVIAITEGSFTVKK